MHLRDFVCGIQDVLEDFFSLLHLFNSGASVESLCIVCKLTKAS